MIVEMNDRGAMNQAVLVLSALFVFAGFYELRGDESSIEDVLRMWSHRETETETARLHWVETVSRRGWNPQTRRPDEPVVEEVDCVLWLGEGSNVRYESMALRDPVERDDSLVRAGLRVSTFDGERNRYYTAANGPDDHPRGQVFKGKTYDEIMNYHLHAVLLCYRPSLVVAKQWTASADSGVVEHAATLRIAERNAVLAGRPCVILESTADDAPISLVNRYWVDVERGGLILQHVSGRPGEAATRLTIEYQQNDDGWAPAAWDAQFLSGTLSASGSLVDVTLNEPIPAEMFQIAFPAGTVVFDRDREKQFRVDAGETEPAE